MTVHSRKYYTKLPANVEMWLKDYLSPQHWLVFDLWRRGSTQKSIGQQFNLSQVAVHKMLFGYRHYSKKYHGKIYGGILPKIEKLKEMEHNES